MPAPRTTSLPPLAQLALAQLPPFNTALSKQVAAGAQTLDRALQQVQYTEELLVKKRSSKNCVWQEGSSQLLQIGDGSGCPILLVPSLVNGAGVLDLAPNHSLAQFLTLQGFSPYLLDWGALGKDERHFTLADYQQRLRNAWQTRQFLNMLSYCMGCCLSLELAKQQPAINKLVLLAPPYDFRQMATASEHQQLQQAWPWLERVIYNHGYLPAAVLQYLFVARDPQAVADRYARFTHATDSDTLHIQARLDAWLNQGKDVAAGVARTSLHHWYIQQQTSIQAVQDMLAKTLVVTAAYDTIVPPAASAGLLKDLPNAELYTATTSHLGLVTSRKSQHWWDDIAIWFKS